MSTTQRAERTTPETTPETAPETKAGWTDPMRGDPDAPTRAEARLVAGVIAREPGLSAAAVAARANEAAALFGDGGRRRLDARLVRRLVWIARRWLGAPIVARPGGEGYRMCGSMAEAVSYAERCRRLGRDYFALAAVVLGRADLAVGDQLALEAIDRLAPDNDDWRRMDGRLRELIGPVAEQVAAGR